MRRRRVLTCVATILLSMLAAGCVQTVARDAEGVSVDVGWLGEVAPGTRALLSSFSARDHCAALGRRAELVDLRGSVAIYRCVVKE